MIYLQLHYPHEINMVQKDWRRVDLHVALCCPNNYRTGMTGLTLQVLYAMLNARDDTLCERVFMEGSGSPPLSLESHQPLTRFDVLAFSLQYEFDYANALTMLRDAGIPLRRDSRNDKTPILMAGGSAVTANPTILSDFFDLIIIGEWEPVSRKVVDCLKEAATSRDSLDSLRESVGVYLPDLDQSKVQRSWAKDLDLSPHPTAQVVPQLKDRDPMSPIFGICFSLEVTRSCDRGCRFCMACWIGRPKRERSLQKLEKILEDARRQTPVSKVSLIGAGISDHSRLKEIPTLVSSWGFRLSVPSLRVESIDKEIATAIAEGGQRTVSLAPEAASPRLRHLIGKDLTEDRLFSASQLLLDSGVTRLKLYFLIGLPGEEQSDINLIPVLARRILKMGFSEIVLSINPFVPKPHTPFQRKPFADLKYLRNSIRAISSSIKTGRIRVQGTDPRDAQIQAILSMGNSETGKVVELASLYGSNLGAWRRAFKESSCSPKELLDPHTTKEGPLPWDFVKMGTM